VQDTYWLREQFMEKWQEQCPFAEFPMLAGLVVCTQAGPETRLRYVDVERLPRTPQGRLRALFAIKPRYTHEELAPFVTDLLGPSQTAAQLLLKHTRTVDSGGVREYALK
jgi:sister chromatid cohesion protein DCC1